MLHMVQEFAEDANWWKKDCVSFLKQYSLFLTLCFGNRLYMM